MKRVKPAVFCVESDWSRRLDDESSVRPLLETLKAVGKIDFVYRHAPTVDAFTEVVRRWGLKQHARYSVGYFAFHGSPGHIWLGRNSVSLDELAELLRGRCTGRTLYFGSCSTLDISNDEIARFRKVTGARAVAGYLREVQWLESAAFDLLLLEALTWYRRPDAVENWLRKQYPSMVERLGFVMHYGSR